MFGSMTYQPLCFLPQSYPMVAPMQVNPAACIQRSKIVKGTWTEEEDERLRAAVQNGSPIMWDVVARAVGDRTAKQCRERWSYRLNPDLKKTPFEQWEDDLIYEQKQKIGNRWTQIAQKLPGRTSCSVKNRWYTVLRNRYNSEPSDLSCGSPFSIESLLNR